jgi:peptidoglycan/LPS O-acetylase OafA/YrhL
MAVNPQVRFLPELEALRGVASVTVLIGHCYLLFGVPLVSTRLAGRIVHGLLDPQPPVLLFFVISGLVLRLQLFKEGGALSTGFAPFIVRRTFRLIPPMWVSIGFATLILAWSNPGVLNIHLILMSMLLQVPGANLVLWSLDVEFYCSLVFPILFWWSQKVGVFGNLALIGLLGGLMFVPTGIGPEVALQYIVFFQVGIFVGIAQERWPIVIKTRAAPILFMVAILLYAGAPQIAAGSARAMTYNQWSNWMWLEVPACFFIVWFAAYRSKGAAVILLRSQLARFFGRISFSLYLYHWPILLVLVPIAKQHSGDWPRFSFVLMTTTVLEHFPVTMNRL